MRGFLFSYDWIVIGGAKSFYEPFFVLITSAMKGSATSSAMIGCLLGAVGSGVFPDRYGRKRLMLLSGLIFMVSSVGVGLANQFSTFIIY